MSTIRLKPRTNIREIKYTNKITAAHTQYVNVSDQDKQFLMEQLLKLNVLITGYIRPHSDIKLRDKYKALSELDTKIPYGRGGHNSLSTFISGVTSNWILGSQRDLSDKQIQGIEYCLKKAKKACPEADLSEVSFKCVG